MLGSAARQRLKRGNGSRIHSLIQGTVASWLSSRGFDVYPEERLGEDLVADIYAESPWATVIVEVETGFIDPRALDRPEVYLLARVVAKASRYSRYADYFTVAIPSYLSLDEAALRAVLSGDPTPLGAGGAWEVLALVRRPRPGGLQEARVDAILRVNVTRRSVQVEPLRRGLLL
ncbi:hypothetical protein ACAM_0714 [Aeropyrum camini SY1 = JCM 12091]|uniref:Uncharacterized protein n=1 Tax=Aeropyrum camini SY1 = JCM 12091 TaxID=1198449 RepID=U3TE02_9CREN|nr:hypothetical protein ACAM_0714 [Aeropyrum camini SY1 = JCM 12091]